MNFSPIQEWFDALIQINSGEKPTTNAARVITFLMAVKCLKVTYFDFFIYSNFIL